MDSPKKASPSRLVIFFLIPHPFPNSPLQTRCRCPKGHLQRISLTIHDKHADFGVSVAFSCVPSKPTQKRALWERVFMSTSFPPDQNTNMPTWAHWWSVLHSQTRKRTPYGCVFMSGYIPSTSGHPLMYPNGYVSGVWLLVFDPNPFL